MRPALVLLLLLSGSASAQMYCDPQEDLRYWVCETPTQGEHYRWAGGDAIGYWTGWVTPSIATFTCIGNGVTTVHVAIYPDGDMRSVSYEYVRIVCQLPAPPPEADGSVWGRIEQLMCQMFMGCEPIWQEVTIDQ